ncbi:MAG: hypothetical protein PHP46_01610 [Candidatus Omnitrophica bacterium]|nr:hypothetical protein [Candidatus Omnitrophota bacterium]
MKYLCVALVFLSVLCAGPCMAREIDVDRDGDGTMDGVDVYDQDDRKIRSGYDMDHDGNIERWQTYDPNTGLPDVVPSDSLDEIE